MNSFEQGLLRYLTKPQLRRIGKVTLGIGGAGGLGSNVALALVRSGFKYFEIIDHDRIEASNLNRQQYFINEIGRLKVSVLKHRLLQVNPDAKIKTHAKTWSAQDGARYFKDCAFVIEAFDQAKNKASFVDHYQSKALILVSGNGLAGVQPQCPLKIKKLGNIYFVGDMATGVSTEHPPMAPRVMTCAAMMAELVLSLTLNKS